jgi:molecular chaperone GrpE
VVDQVPPQQAQPDLDAPQEPERGPSAPQERGAMAGNGGPADAGVDELRERVRRLEEQWRRALADLDNYRKRVARDADRMRADERARVAGLWLPILDNLDLALEHSAADPNAIVEGVRAMRDQAIALLAGLGFPRRSDVGVEFDPSRHEAVATVPTDGAPVGTVVQVVRPGYGDDERQLRPAAVVVARGD